MEITFSEARVRDLCCCRDTLVRVYGPKVGRKVRTRLSLLAAASSLDDLPASPPISLAAVDGAGTYSLALGSSHRLLFRASPAAKRGRASNATTEIEIIGPVPVLGAKGKTA